MTTCNLTLARTKVAERGLVHCEGCGGDVVPVRPSRLWYLAAIANWAVLLVVAPIASIFPLCFVGIPVLFGIALPIVSFTSEKVNAEPRCPACDKFMIPRVPQG